MAAYVPFTSAESSVRTRQQHTNLRPIRTVVVDDSPDVLEVICALLEMEDRVEVVGRAASGSEALEAVVTLVPELVVMDIQMPKMDGLTAAALIRLAFPATSIVLMSGDPSPDLEHQIRACGADAFIYKPDFRQVFPSVLRRVTSTAQQHV